MITSLVLNSDSTLYVWELLSPAKMQGFKQEAFECPQGKTKIQESCFFFFLYAQKLWKSLPVSVKLYGPFFFGALELGGQKVF